MKLQDPFEAMLHRYRGLLFSLCRHYCRRGLEADDLLQEATVALWRDRERLLSLWEIILYQPDNSIRLEVMLREDTVWLTQAQMSLLFQSTKQNISLHINNIFREGELDKFSVVKDFLTTAADGKNYHTLYYNLDVIISVGYRVKSIRGTQFRQWANSVLKDYLLRGYVIRDIAGGFRTPQPTVLINRHQHFRPLP